MAEREMCARPQLPELFFKWIKQPLRIKTFYGILKNTVKTQIRIAIFVLGAKK